MLPIRCRTTIVADGVYTLTAPQLCYYSSCYTSVTAANSPIWSGKASSITGQWEGGAFWVYFVSGDDGFYNSIIRMSSTPPFSATTIVTSTSPLGNEFFRGLALSPVMPTPSQSVSPSPTSSASPTSTETLQWGLSQSSSGTSSASEAVSRTQSPSQTQSVLQSSLSSASPTQVVSVDSTHSPSQVASPSSTSTASNAVTMTQSMTPSISPSMSPSIPHSMSPSSTQSASVSPTMAPSQAVTPPESASQSASTTQSVSSGLTYTRTRTSSHSLTQSCSQADSLGPAGTLSSSNSPTRSSATLLSAVTSTNGLHAVATSPSATSTVLTLRASPSPSGDNGTIVLGGGQPLFDLELVAGSSAAATLLFLIFLVCLIVFFFRRRRFAHQARPKMPLAAPIDPYVPNNVSGACAASHLPGSPVARSSAVSTRVETTAPLSPAQDVSPELFTYKSTAPSLALGTNVHACTAMLPHDTEIVASPGALNCNEPRRWIRPPVAAPTSILPVASTPILVAPAVDASIASLTGVRAPSAPEAPASTRNAASPPRVKRIPSMHVEQASTIPAHVRRASLQLSRAQPSAAGDVATLASRRSSLPCIVQSLFVEQPLAPRISTLPGAIIRHPTPGQQLREAWAGGPTGVPTTDALDSQMQHQHRQSRLQLKKHHLTPISTPSLNPARVSDVAAAVFDVKAKRTSSTGSTLLSSVGASFYRAPPHSTQAVSDSDAGGTRHNRA